MAKKADLAFEESQAAMKRFVSLTNVSNIQKMRNDGEKDLKIQVKSQQQHF